MIIIIVSLLAWLMPDASQDWRDYNKISETCEKNKTQEGEEEDSLFPPNTGGLTRQGHQL